MEVNMALVLRKCKSDGSSRNDFFYGQAGDTVTCPDWDPEAVCGGGLHGLKNGNGNWDLLDGDDWLVIDVDEADLVDIDDRKCKFRTGKIIYRGSSDGLHKFANVMATDSSSAYDWAINIGDKEIMRDRVNDYDAYMWSVNIGDKEIMVHKFTGNSATLWAWRHPYDRHIVIDKVDEESAYKWACYIGDREIMRDRVTNYWAYCWAIDIGDEELMRSKISDPSVIIHWNYAFPNLAIT
jgi:hypothetical protein